mgnify:FL=1
MTRLRVLLLLVFLLSGITCVPALSLKQSLEEADDLSVGDRFILNIRGDGPLKSVELPDTLTNFYILKVEEKDKGTDKAWLRLTIVPLLPGSQSFPGLRVRSAKDSGESALTNRFRLNIISVRAQGDTLLADLKPLSKYPLQLPSWLYPLLLLAGAALLLLSWLLNRKKEKPNEAPAATKPPAVIEPEADWQTALRELDELRARNLLAQGKLVLHHFELSLIQRRFMERRLGLPAVEMTTSEIRRALAGKLQDNPAPVLGFLAYCDKVKFARYNPDPGEIREAEDWLRQWLLSYQPMAPKTYPTGEESHAALR